MSSCTRLSTVLLSCIHGRIVWNRDLLSRGVGSSSGEELNVPGRRWAPRGRPRSRFRCPSETASVCTPPFPSRRRTPGASAGGTRRRRRRRREFLAFGVGRGYEGGSTSASRVWAGLGLATFLDSLWPSRNLSIGPVRPTVDARAARPKAQIVIWEFP